MVLGEGLHGVGRGSPWCWARVSDPAHGPDRRSHGKGNRPFERSSQARNSRPQPFQLCQRLAVTRAFSQHLTPELVGLGTIAPLRRQGR